MQHRAANAHRLPGAWRSRLRSFGRLRAGAVRCARALRPVGIATLTLVLLSAPIARAARGRSGGHTTTPRPAGYLGIEFHDLTPEQAQALHLRSPEGVEVLLVDHDGPAAAAGLRPHDLITGLNGHVVASGEALRRMIRDTGAGVQVTLAVFRNGNPIIIRTKLANREDVERKAWLRLTQPEPPPPVQTTVVEGFSETYVASASPSQPAAAPHTQGFIANILHGPFTGLEIEAMPSQLASYFGAPNGQGLLVQSVAGGSPAAEAGVHAGDVILRANGVPMRSSSEWTKQLHARKGKSLTLDVLRDHHELTLTLASDAKKR